MAGFIYSQDLEQVAGQPISAANPVPTNDSATAVQLLTRLDRLIAKVEDLTNEVQRMRLGMIWAESPVCVDLENELSLASVQEE